MAVEDFEKNARVLEDGCAPEHSTNSTDGSPTLTNSSTFVSEQSTDLSTVAGKSITKSNFFSRLFGASTEKIAVEPNFSDEHVEGLGDCEDIPVEETRPPVRPIKVRSLQRFKDGYPHLAAFADSAESYMVYRRFGYLQSRILLEKQDELRRLEEQLDDLDDKEKNDHPDNLVSRDFQGEPRKNLLTQIEQKFVEYAQIVGAAQQFMAAHRPTRSEHRSILNFMASNPVREPESEYVYCKEDLISLRPGREHAWLDRGIEHCLRKMHCNVIENIFGSKETKEKSSDPNHVYYCKERIDTCAGTIITMMILFLLIVPIYLLYNLVEKSHGLLSSRDTALCIGILLIFTLIFSAAMSFFTKARRHEILAAAAAYCAVLVVFMGNVGN